ncbi:MAG: phage holin family protein [Nitrospirota bacterium]
MHFLIRLLINTLALWITTKVVSGITYTGPATNLFLVALVFGVLNAFVRPLLKILTFPLLIVTLGLFILVLNSIMLLLTSAVSDALELGFHVRGFWPAFWGSLVISIINMVFSIFVREE